jgi:peptidoglycan/xylan/chitin deacetylase (PgdA/CDA1 family)
LLLAGSRDVEVEVRLSDRNLLPGEYRFDPRDRLELSFGQGRQPLPLEDARVFRGRLRAKIPRLPAARTGFLRLVLDQTARGGGRTGFDCAIRVVRRLRVVLTFDDGPVPAGDPADGNVRGSPTDRVLDVLAGYRHGPGRGRRGLKAVFFVLTSPERFMGRTYPKGGTADGAELMARAAREGHLLAAHWGGKYRKQGYHHTSRVDGDDNGLDDDGDSRVDEDRAYDIDGDGRPDGQCALESDLLQCVRRIEAVAGRRPEFVRPPEWVWRSPRRPEVTRRVLACYRRLGLKMVLTDAKLGDGGYSLLSRLSLEGRMLKRSLRRAVRLGHADLVLTMHDSNPQTAARLERWLRRVERILAGITLGGRRLDPLTDVEFVSDPDRLRELLRTKRRFAIGGPRDRPPEAAQK